MCKIIWDISNNIQKKIMLTENPQPNKGSALRYIFGQSLGLCCIEAQLYLDTGGGDRPENVFGGMEHVKSQSWRAPLTRILVHIADAPDHGDFRNRGSSPRRRANSLLRHLKCSTNVYTYLFIKTHCCFSDLNRMIQAFKVYPRLLNQTSRLSLIAPLFIYSLMRCIHREYIVGLPGRPCIIFNSEQRVPTLKRLL